jgi:hypothetical protein
MQDTKITSSGVLSLGGPDSRGGVNKGISFPGSPTPGDGAVECRPDRDGALFLIGGLLHVCNGALRVFQKVL